MAGKKQEHAANMSRLSINHNAPHEKRRKLAENSTPIEHFPQSEQLLHLNIMANPICL